MKVFNTHVNLFFLNCLVVGKTPQYKVRLGRALGLVLGLLFVSGSAWGQTNPTAQSLPYTQSFGTTTFTTMPAGMAAWNTFGSNLATQANAEASVPGGNATLTAATVSTTTGGVYGYAVSSNARPYIQQSSNTTDGTNQIVAAVNTGAATALTVAYQLELINGGVTTQDFGIELQYRAGTSGSWTNVSGSALTFGAVTTYTTSTLSYTITGLASSTDYQIRWITWRPSGSGNSKGVGIDNISITAAYVSGGNIGAPGVNFVGRINSYTQPNNCAAADYRVLNYRRLSTASGTPTDGRGQWYTTVNVQASGGNVTADNMPGGGGAGFLFTNGGTCGSAGTYTNKWVFGGTGQGSLNAVNGTTYNGSTDMGLNMGTAGRYTFVMKDVTSSSPSFYVGYTTNAPVAITTPVVSTFGSTTATVTATISATPSSQEVFYLRYRTTNDFTLATSQVLGSVSGNTVTFNLTGLTQGTAYFYHVLSTTHATYTSLTEGDKSLSVLNYADNGGNNYTFTTSTPTTYTWAGGTAGSWATPSNWSPSTSAAGPSTGDAVIFTTGGNMAISSVPTVTLTNITVSTSGSNVTLTPASGSAGNTITLSNASTALSVASGTTLNLIGNLTTPTTLGLVYSGAGNTATIAGTLNLNSAGTSATSAYTATNSTTTVSGIMSRTTNCSVVGTAANLIISSTGTFQMKGNAASAPTATWSAGSTLEMNQTISSATSITNLAQSFSNVTINAAMTSPGTLDFGGALTTIGGNLTVTTTGTGTAIFNSTAISSTTAVGGLYSQAGGTVNVATSTGTTTINIAGSGTSTVSGGTLNLNGAAAASPTLAFTSATGNFTQSGGTINLQNGYTGSGVSAANFTVGGNFSQTAGTFEFATSATTSTTATYSLNIAGTFSRSGTTTIMQATGGSFFGGIFMNGGASQSISVTSTTATTNYIQYLITSGSTTALLSNIKASVVSILAGGTLNCADKIISDANTTCAFTNNGTLGIGSTSGITSGTTLSGNIQGTGTRTYTASANYTYNGIANQVTGNGLSTALSGILAIANTGTSPNNIVTLSQATTTSGTLALTSGSLDLNALTLTLSADVAQSIAGSAGNTFNIAGAAGSTLALSAPTTSHVVTLSNFGTATSANLTTGANVNVRLNANTQLDCAGNGTTTSMLTILGTLTMNSSTASNIANIHPPFYGAASTLVYAANYGRFNEWNATSGPGYPNNVTVTGSSTLNAANGVQSYKKAAGNLTVNAGSTFSVPDLTTGNGSGVGVEFLGNIVNDGTISLNTGSNTTSQRIKGANLTNGNANTSAIVNLSGAIGGDMELTGNYLDNATFTANARAVFFTGTGTQTISGTATAPFNIDYIVVTKASGIVQLGVDLLTGAPNGGNGLTLSTTTDILDLNGRTFTLGTAGQACTISGNGFIRSSSTGSMVINGTGSASGTLKFETGNQTIGGLTINRTATGLVTLGTPLTVATTLSVVSTSTLNNGGNALTVSASGNNTVAGILAGTGALTKTGAGTLTLTAASGNNTANTYTGTTTINGAGTGTINVTGLTNITSTAITSATQSVTFSSTTPANGTYQLLPGALTVGTQAFSSNAGASKLVTFNYTNSTVTVADATPIITGAATATAFTTTYGTASSVQTFTVGGTNLTANLVATAPTGFEVSSDGTTYASTATFTQSGGTASGSLSIRLAATATVAGSYNAQNIVLSSTGATSVNITTAASGNTVNTKALTITGLTANNKVYNGTTAATLSGTAAYSGLANGETPSVSGTPTATFASANIGTAIAITVSGYTAPSANYTLTQPTGLTANITAAPLSITVAADNKTYDGTTTATLGTATLNGVIAADVSNVTLSGSGVTAAFANATVGNSKAVTLTGSYTISGSASGNYSLTQPSGLTANITQAVLTVTADNATRVYGAANPTFTVSYSGFVGSENASNLTTAPTATTTATSASNVGTYDIVPSGGVSTNYSFTYVNGTLTITQASQTITFNALTARCSNTAAFALSATSSSGLAVTFASGTPSVATVSGSTVTIVGAGSTDITASQAGNGNYAAATDVVQSFTVNARPTESHTKVDDNCQLNTGSITITISGGLAPYSIVWSSGGLSSGSISTSGGTLTVNSLTGGVSYIFTATDSNGCTAQ